MQNTVSVSFEEAKGVIPFNMTNDYMFRYILQENQTVLEGLVCSLLHLKPEEVQTIEIRNPIDLGQQITRKDFILDIKVLLNNHTLINLEMQMWDEANWTDRSLSYLCRNYDQLYRGQEYDEALPVYHIGFLDFTLFPACPEFYATYRMLNVKNHHLYSDKLTLGVVDLNQINLATQEDKTYKIDNWARLFKAETWEAIKMLAKEDKYLEETAKSLYVANADELLLEQCRAREEAERHERTIKRDMKQLNDRIAALTEDIASLEDNNASLKDDNASLKDDNARLRARIAELEAEQQG